MPRVHVWSLISSDISRINAEYFGSVECILVSSDKWICQNISDRNKNIFFTHRLSLDQHLEEKCFLFHAKPSGIASERVEITFSIFNTLLLDESRLRLAVIFYDIDKPRQEIGFHFSIRNFSSVINCGLSARVVSHQRRHRHCS